MKFRQRKQERQLADAIDRGRRLLLSGDHQETVQFLSRAVEDFPDDAQLQLLYATVLMVLQPDQVARHAAKAVELEPDEPAILVRAANLMMSRKEVERARFYAARASELAPPDFHLMPNLKNITGLIAAIDGKDGVAEANLRSAVESQPTSAPFVSDLARFFASRRRISEALATIDAGIVHVDEKENLVQLRVKIQGDGLKADR